QYINYVNIKYYKICLSDGIIIVIFTITNKNAAGAPALYMGIQGG
ncbi:unnamed protein product, partial [marine sediment metagenome]